MTRDEIKAILPNITKEELDKIMSINGTDIEKAKGDSATLTNQINNLTAQITERDRQLKELKDKVTDNAELTKQIADLQTANATAKSNYEKTVAEMKENFALNNSVRDSKAKNVKAVIALLDRSKIKMDGDNLIGLKEQIEALQKSDAYLFEEEDPTHRNFKGGFEPGKGSNGSNGNATPTSFSDAIGASLAKIGIIK